jgi:hypothetical protein
MKKDLFYHYKNDNVILASHYRYNDDDMIFNYSISIDYKNKLDSSEELYIIGSKFKESLLFY